MQQCLVMQAYDPRYSSPQAEGLKVSGYLGNLARLCYRRNSNKLEINLKLNEESCIIGGREIIGAREVKDTRRTKVTESNKQGS